MTDLLSTLLRDEAASLDVPPAPAERVLKHGHRLQNRRRAGLAAGLVIVVASVAGVAALASSDDRGAPDSTVLAPASPADPSGWAVATGSTIHLGSGTTVSVEGQVKALYYTSAGVMVRTGATSATDAPDSNYWVMAGDGTVHDFELHLGDRKPGTDPTLPYLAYAVEGDDSDWELVLRDVRTGEVATRLPFDGAFTWGGWEAPPVTLSGDYAYVGVDDATLRIAWRTGTVEAAEGLPPSRMPTVAGGRELVEPVIDYDRLSQEELRDLDSRPQTWRVVDAETGALVREITVRNEYVTLSPDGRYVSLATLGWFCFDGEPCGQRDPVARVIDLATGGEQEFPVGEGLTGWTPDGQLLLVERGEVRSCAPSSGECTRTPVDLGNASDVRISGNAHES